MSSRAQHRASRVSVLEAIRATGPASRVELAAATGLTQATISTTVRDLIADGLVEETGERTPTRGKPRTLLQLVSAARCAIGVQIGADAILVAVVDAVGAVVARTRLHGAREQDPRATVARIAEAIAELVLTAGLPRERIIGLGVVTPGLLDIGRGVILRSRSLGHWVGRDLRAEFGQLTGLDVITDNDATAAALGEFWGGELPGSRAHCTVYMGDSVGAGLLMQGTVYRGASANTGAIGSIAVRRGSGWRGSTVEDLATPRAVVERARAAIATGAATTAALSDDGDWYRDFQSISVAAVRGDDFSIGLIRESCEYLGDGVVTVANLLDLDSITLAGPAFTIAGTLYLRHLVDRLASDAFAAERHPVQVRLSSQLADAAAVGAAALVLQRDLRPGADHDRSR